MASRPLLALVLLLALPLAAGCAREDPGPRWIRLATLDPAVGEPPRVRVATFPPAPLPPGADPGGAPQEPREVRLEPAGSGRRLVVDVPRETWRWNERQGIWRVPVGLRGKGRAPQGVESPRLVAPGRSFRALPPGFLPRGATEPGSYYVSGGMLFLVLAEGEQPPAQCTFESWVATGEGQAAAPARVSGNFQSGEGFVVLPGERRELVLDLPPRAALRATFCAEPFRSEHEDLEARRERVGYRVLLDGAPLAEGELDVPLDGASRPIHAVLPPAGAEGARLAFEVSGQLAFTSFVAPVVGPAEVGRPGARPWGAGRPDLVLFQADTFRADNMAAYGGEPGLTPFLDALARESLLFRRAWSVSTYTLPAHASIFSGLYPAQAGVTDIEQRLPEGVPTIVEALAAAGYRTGAITDSGLVSQLYGFDRPFGWFSERIGDLASTLERTRAFLDADDGRPVFLFVQTYRTHAPYASSAETRRALEGRLEVRGDLAELTAALQALSPTDPGDGERLVALAKDLETHYRAGVAELDRALAGFHAELAARGLFEHGWLLFTSDHGEAFGEHGLTSHRGPVWEELTRIPLLLQGPGLEPRVVEHSASLVDLAPTLAELAGIPPPPGLVGRSLLGLDEDRPVYLFQSEMGTPLSTLAVVVGERKVVAREDPESVRAGEVLAAFDLGRDPLERDDRAAAGDPWPAQSLAQHRERLLELLRPRFGSEVVQLGDEDAAELEALGYVGR